MPSKTVFKFLIILLILWKMLKVFDLFLDLIKKPLDMKKTQTITFSLKLYNEQYVKYLTSWNFGSKAVYGT